MKQMPGPLRKMLCDFSASEKAVRPTKPQFGVRSSLGSWEVL